MHRHIEHVYKKAKEAHLLGVRRLEEEALHHELAELCRWGEVCGRG